MPDDHPPRFGEDLNLHRAIAHARELKRALDLIGSDRSIQIAKSCIDEALEWVKKTVDGKPK
jgi:hypothetical protein